jgi:hypothetical protein
MTYTEHSYNLSRLRARLENYKKQTWHTLREAVHSRYAEIHGGSWESIADMAKYSSPSDRAFYVDNFGGFRIVGDSGEVNTRQGHNGWYCDIWQEETVTGVVLQMPARNGEPRYFPAVKWSDREGVTLYPLDIYDNKEDAARAADHIAERIGEEEREYSLKDRAEQDIEDAREEIKAAREERRALVAEMKQQDRNAARPAICAALRKQLADLKRQSRKAWKLIQERTENPYTADPSYR